MDIQRRIERRFFFSMDGYRKIQAILANHPRLQRLVFAYPVTQTVYFTLGGKDHSLPDDFYVRLRRYVRSESDSVFIDHSSVFLEFKSRGEAAGLNLKRKMVVNGREAVALLMQRGPALYPTAATEVRRLHWVLGKKSRITLDADTRFFGFSSANWFVGHPMGHLNKGKIEFKWGGEPTDYPLFLEKEIRKNCELLEYETSYTERRMRECHALGIQRKVKRSS